MNTIVQSGDQKLYRRWLREWNGPQVTFGSVRYFVRYRNEDGVINCLETEPNYHRNKALLVTRGGTVVASSVTRIRLYLKGLDAVEWGEV